MAVPSVDLKASMSAHATFLQTNAHRCVKVPMVMILKRSVHHRPACLVLKFSNASLKKMWMERPFLILCF